MSKTEDNNEAFLGEEADGTTESSAGRRRPTTERSSSDFPKPKKAKKKQAHRAEVWQHFIEKEDLVGLARCRYCSQQIGCDTKLHGTSSMKSHLLRCKFFKAHQDLSTQKVLAGDMRGAITTVPYDKALFRRSVNELLVLCELPFAFVESEGFRRFCANMLPLYTVHCRRTATEDVFKMFLSETAKLKSLFSCEQQRVSLTTAIWVAPTTACSYMVITAHWIDRGWDLQKRIIWFKPVTDHKGDTIADHLRAYACRSLGPNALVRDGSLIHMCCCAHILNLIVRDGLAKVNESIVAIRNAIRYVRSSGDRLKSFKLRVETELHLRSYFQESEEDNGESGESGPEGAKKRVGPPTSKGWDDVQRLVKFLKIFFNCTLAFSATKTVTSTICYHEIVLIERSLINLSINNDQELRLEAMDMRAKLEKYWDGLINMNPLVIIASVFDPRNKMQFANICFDKLYGKDSLESDHLKSSIKKLLKNLFEEYVQRLCNNSQAESTRNKSGEVDDLAPLFEEDDELESRGSLCDELATETVNDVATSELDIYLLEKAVPRQKNRLGMDYDVLSWWRRNSHKFPVLSEFVKDVLAIQVSSVASESAFSTSGRILDPFRSCLSPHMVESLICTQQWLRNTIHQEKLANLVQMLEELDFHESLVAGPKTVADDADLPP
ncbi:unnamed protein product [Arabidopsis arenosa]|uniref:BED-type domain-containing protein n=1 Tax=Arabidopsis arenosa TaxID=38785 RepID=A0A8S2AWL5_ARAAE|nr:unnamed protein product [Arabidopsis arenosa]